MIKGYRPRGSKWPVTNFGEAQTGRPPLKCAMLVYEGLTMLDLIGPHSAWCGPFDTMLVGKTKDIVYSDMGVPMRPEYTFDEIPKDIDVLFAGGGQGQADVVRDDETLEFLADRGSRAKYITSVCTGTLILGAAGLMKGYKATTHWAALEMLRQYGAEPVGERIVIDRNRYSGGGVTAGIDFGLTLMAEIFGDRNAMMTQLMMEYDPAPPFNAGHPSRVEQSLIDEAMKIMMEPVEAIGEAAKEYQPQAA